MHDVGGPVFLDDTNDVPAQCIQLGSSAEILDVLGPIGAVLVPVVLDRHQELLPAHIESAHEAAALVEHNDLCAGPR